MVWMVEWMCGRVIEWINGRKKGKREREVRWRELILPSLGSNNIYVQCVDRNLNTSSSNGHLSGDYYQVVSLPRLLVYWWLVVGELKRRTSN